MFQYREGGGVGGNTLKVCNKNMFDNLKRITEVIRTQ